MTRDPIRCLILACGNTLRGDDGVGPWLAEWARERFPSEPSVRVIARQQWTPDLAEEIAQAESVLFIDCDVDSAPGAVRIARVQQVRRSGGLASHHVEAHELLALCEELYSVLPRNAMLLIVGAGSTEMAEGFSDTVEEALPQTCRMLECTIRDLLDEQ
jgi:hydrogenase maturation protease